MNNGVRVSWKFASCGLCGRGEAPMGSAAWPTSSVGRMSVPKFHTFLVGLGRSGRGLHLPVLARTRALERYRHLFADAPFIAWDPSRHAAELPGTQLAGSLAEAASMAAPERTVVHVCTPPTVRAEVLERLAWLGYRMYIVEKPLATDAGELARIDRLRRSAGLQMEVVAPWLASALTARIQTILGDGQLGRLHAISVLQRKPRFTRTQAGDGHPTAFDIEMPHAVGLALRLAGKARVVEAACADMRFDPVVIPNMGRAWLVLEHTGGPRTEVDCDLTSPVRERCVILKLDGGTLIGHYSSSDEDDAAQLRIRVGGLETSTVFRDDALATFLTRTYERFAASTSISEDLSLNCEVVRLLARAKWLSRHRGPDPPPWAAFVSPPGVAAPNRTAASSLGPSTRGSAITRPGVYPKAGVKP